MSVRAVFWDIDGTMVMSEAVHESKNNHIAIQHGLTLSLDVQKGFHGTSDHNVYNVMSGMGMPGTLEEFMIACNDYYRSLIHTIDIRDGFMEAFSYFEENGVVQSAVSNGCSVLVGINIERVAIRHRLKAVIDIDYVRISGLNPKPAADPYLEALRQVNETTGLAIQPAECLVIEDSPTGARAGKAAGMQVIFWKLSLEKTLAEADHEAHTGGELMEIIKNLQSLKVAA